MLISYEPNADILTITLESAAVVQSQVQGAATVGFNSAGVAVSVSVADASTILFENGGQVQVALPPAIETITIIEPK